MANTVMTNNMDKEKMVMIMKRQEILNKDIIN
jgi:hypothetical protein